MLTPLSIVTYRTLRHGVFLGYNLSWSNIGQQDLCTWQGPTSQHRHNMHAFNRGGAGGRRQPTPTNVQCQKCLKRGHYSYECKAQLQERPYKARPSRTQQLLNPKLAPKLTNDAPDDATRKLGYTQAFIFACLQLTDCLIGKEWLMRSWPKRRPRGHGNGS